LLENSFVWIRLMNSTLDAILIAGPTASGKSAVALGVAKAIGGRVINADSMQVYKDLRVVTARPSAEDEAACPHDLYGMVDASVTYSAAQWGQDVLAAMARAQDAGQVPILVGGTGLYFSVLTEGLSPIPDIPEDVREEVRDLLEVQGVEAVRDEVARVDRAAFERIKPNDRQRIGRALEVYRATGEPLTSWQEKPRQPLFTGNAAKVALTPDREWLYERCNLRFDQMIEEGALREVEALLARGLDPGLPAMKALGVPEIGAYLTGEMTLEEAGARAKMQTRRYAKRQLTWLRNQMIAWKSVSEQQSERKIDEILAFIC
jgi:tRNA dimethylallyltransferase